MPARRKGKLIKAYKRGSDWVNNPFEDCPSGSHWGKEHLQWLGVDLYDCHTVGDMGVAPLRPDGYLYTQLREVYFNQDWTTVCEVLREGTKPEDLNRFYVQLHRLTEPWRCGKVTASQDLSSPLRKPPSRKLSIIDEHGLDDPEGKPSAGSPSSHSFEKSNDQGKAGPV